jgi:curli biogenesis system outer membrane secretion channel CsgG
MRRVIVCAIAIALSCSAASADGLRKSIAVAGFDGTISFEGGDAAQGLTTMLTDALIKDGRFLVVERQAMADVSAEHQRGATATQRITPASVLVRGTVTKFLPKASGGGLSGGMFGGGSFGGTLGISGDTSVVELNIRMIDPGSGTILASIDVKGSASSKGINASLYTRSGMSFGGEAFNASPLGQACQQAIAQALDQIAASMDKVGWSAQVLSSDTGQIYIDAGSLQNVQVGETFVIYRKGKVLTDPTTGAVIDVIETPVAKMSIASVREKTSAGLLSEGIMPQPGDVVREK